MKTPPLSDPAALLAPLRAKVHGLTHRTDYFVGVARDQEPLPYNILLFNRLRAMDLMGQSRFRSHHGRYVLIVNLQGAGHVCIDDEAFLLKPGEAVLVPPFAFHAYSDCQEEIVWLFTTFDAAVGVASAATPTLRMLGEVELVLAREIVHCWETPSQRELLPLHLGLLLARMAAFGKEPLHRRGRVLDSEKAELLRSINGYILPRLSEPLTLQEIARALGQSESHLRARFREVTSLSLGRHLHHLRLQRASQLLHSTTLPVGEIATRCGFESIYAFSRAFRRHRKLSPTAYRKWGQDLAIKV